MLKVFDIFDSVEKEAVLGTPIKIGQYSLDTAGTVTPTSVAAKYFRSDVLEDGSVCFDLNRGFEANHACKSRDEVISETLTWATLSSPPKTTPKKAFHDADFVSTRGMLARITASLMKNDDWQFVARLVDDVIYMCDCRDVFDYTLPTYYGLKFEQYVTKDRQGKTDTNGSVFDRDEYRVMMKSTLDGGKGKQYNLVYSVEVDALDEDGGLVELKTGVDGKQFPLFKMLWCATQARFAGIDSIVVGWRTYNGFVQRVNRTHFASTTNYNIDAYLQQGHNVLATVLDETKRQLTSLKMGGVAFPWVRVRFDKHGQRVHVESDANEPRFIPKNFCDYFNIPL